MADLHPLAAAVLDAVQDWHESIIADAINYGPQARRDLESWRDADFPRFPAAQPRPTGEPTGPVAAAIAQARAEGRASAEAERDALRAEVAELRATIAAERAR